MLLYKGLHRKTDEDSTALAWNVDERGQVNRDMLFNLLYVIVLNYQYGLITPNDLWKVNE